MSEPEQDVNLRAARVRLVLMDVDGVLTDGRIHLGSGSEEGRTFYVRDGLAIKMGQVAGLEFGILSGRDSPVVARRAAELAIAHVHQGILEKGVGFDRIVAETGIPAEQVCFVGDDLIDVPAMRRAGFAASPADADVEARRFAHYVCERKGGAGAVREVVDLILRANGRWSSVMERFLES